jgi:hypothetical protein
MDRDYLAAVTRSSDIRRINLLDREGRVFWSSRPELIGTLHDGDHFAETVVLDQLSDDVEEAHHHSVRGVAEIDLPITLDCAFVGDMEFHRDITHIRTPFIGCVRAVLAFVSAGAALSVLALAWALRRPGRVPRRGAGIGDGRADAPRPRGPPPP